MTYIWLDNAVVGERGRARAQWDEGTSR